MVVQTSQPIAASYERVSTKLQGQHGFSLAAQHRSMEEFASAQDWALPDHLRFRDGEDDNASGASWDLPALNAMLEAAQRREFSVLIVPDLDRFARSLVKGLVLEEQLKKYGVRVVYQRVPVEDTPEGRLLKNQLFSFAEFEREKFILRSLTGRQQKARSGKVVGQSVAPFGYRYTYETLHNGKMRVCGLEPEPVTAPIAQGILRDLLTCSCDAIAGRLNAEGIATPRGRLWTARQVWRIGVSPIYMGDWRFGGRDDYDTRVAVEERSGITVEVPALIDRETWERIQVAMQERQIRRRGRLPVETDPYLLRGILTCGHCHGAMSTDSIHGWRYYGCLRSKPRRAQMIGKPVCDLTGARAEPLEAELWRLVTETLLNVDHLERGLANAREARHGADTLRQDRIEALNAEIARHRQRLNTLANRLVDAGDGELYQALMRQAKDIESLIGKMSAELTSLNAIRAEGLSEAEVLSIQAFAAEVALGIKHATPADRRKLYKMLQIHGTIHTATANDPDSVRLTRRACFRVEWTAVLPLRNNVTSSTSRGMPS